MDTQPRTTRPTESSSSCLGSGTTLPTAELRGNDGRGSGPELLDVAPRPESEGGWGVWGQVRQGAPRPESEGDWGDASCNRYSQPSARASVSSWRGNMTLGVGCVTQRPGVVTAGGEAALCNPTPTCRFPPSVPSRHDPMVAGIWHTPTVGCSGGDGCGSYPHDCTARSGPALVCLSIHRPARGHSKSGGPIASRPRVPGPRRRWISGFGMAAGRPVYRPANGRWTAASCAIACVAATAVATAATDCRRVPDPSDHGVMAARDAWGKTA